MSRQSRDNQHQNPNQHPPPPVNIGDADTSQIIQETERGYVTTNNHTDQPKVNKQWLLNKDNQPIIANIISFLMFGATIGLVFYTVGLFNKTSIQAKAAMAADSIAQMQLDSSRSAKKQSDIADVIRENRENNAFKLQKTVDSSQIEAFKESANEFEIAHSPYVRIEDYNISPNNELVITVENQGSQVAWLVEDEVSIKVEKAKDSIKTVDEVRKWLPIGKQPFNFQTLIAPGGKIMFPVKMDSISKSDMENIKKGKKFIFIRTVLYYFNTTTNKYMEMEDISKFNIYGKQTATISFTYKKLKKYPR